MINFLKKIWDHVPCLYKNKSIVLWHHLNGRKLVAHHGIERSGTNFIEKCLDELSLTPVNKYCPPENEANHKHFRWQPDKTSIIPFGSYKYSHYNNLYASNISELNKKARYPKNTRHLVVKKEFKTWMVSVLNYGMNVKWFNSKQDALDSIVILKKDYYCYYGYWELMAKKNSEFVVVVPYEDVSRSPHLFIQYIKKIGLSPVNEDSFTGVYKELVMSPKYRKSFFNEEDVLRYFEMSRG